MFADIWTGIFRQREAECALHQHNSFNAEKKNNIKVVLVCVEYRPTKPSRRSDPRIIISTSTRPLCKQASLAQANEQLSYEDLQLSCPLHSGRTQRIPNAKIKAKDRFGQYIPNTDENKHNIYTYKYIYS